MSRNRRSPFIIRLCKSLELRYSVSVVASSSNRYSYGYANSARYYFYSTTNKRVIGKPWHKAFKLTRSQIAAAGDKDPPVYEIQYKDIQEALEHLLISNVDMQFDVKEVKSKRTNRELLNRGELLVFWLSHFRPITATFASSLTDAEINKLVAKFFMYKAISSFDLASLETPFQQPLEDACKSLVSDIKCVSEDSKYEKRQETQTAGVPFDIICSPLQSGDVRKKKTSSAAGVSQIVQLVRYTVDYYLSLKGIDSANVNKILARESSVKPDAITKDVKSTHLKSAIDTDFAKTIGITLEWYKDEGLMNVDLCPGLHHSYYVGTLLGGRSVHFVAIRVETEFRQSDLSAKQMSMLDGHQKFGAKCFVLVCFGEDNYYRVPWGVCREMSKIFGQDSISEEVLTQYRIPIENDVIQIFTREYIEKKSKK